ncbi:unnamed protein product [Mytilus coruscus]|uniref:Endonuclease/exonuclease/phosphatase domain-containing protein n=1 Tax=Mytilus coruscus TaxID=42192 RepID=A0A6J8AVL9_MYTCO|nr:unnamed protein product [Mytilus coruscus]
MGLHILQWNARSIYANANSLKHYLDTHNNPEIICVQETHFKDNRYVKLQGYPPIIRNRKIPIQPKGKNKKKPQIGGGVAIYVSIQVNFSELNFNTDNIEVVGVSVNCQNNKINIVNVYRPPNQDIKFNDYQEVLHNLSDNIVLLGDFNIRTKEKIVKKTNYTARVIRVSDSEMESCRNRQYRRLFKTAQQNIVKKINYTARVIRVSDSEMSQAVTGSTAALQDD